MLYTQTAPEIQFCKNIAILPHQYIYDEIYKQMKKANLSIWDNKYWEKNSKTEELNKYKIEFITRERQEDTQ